MKQRFQVVESPNGDWWVIDTDADPSDVPDADKGEGPYAFISSAHSDRAAAESTAESRNEAS